VLSRAAEALFWIGRYAERAEDTTRLLDVYVHQLVEDPAVDEAETCRVVATVMGRRDHVPQTVRGALDQLAFDPENRSSIVGSLTAAWQNARGARESLSREIWSCLNATYVELPQRVSAAREFGPATFFSYVRRRTAMLSGYVGTTIRRDDGYDFLSLGQSLERADMTARLLAAAVGIPARGDHWVTTLRACSAHEAYLRASHRSVSGRPVVEFLLLDQLFPRSVLYALTAAEQAIARLEPAPLQPGGRGRAGKARRTVGRLRTGLEFVPLDSLYDSLPERLNGIQRGVSEASEAVAAAHFAGAAVVGWSMEVAAR
jgi:uncharacterized alpha-E superfamily protein